MICLVIASYLVPEYAVCLLDHQWRTHAAPYRHLVEVDLARDDWARFVTVEDTEYLAGLSNTPAPGYTTKNRNGEWDRHPTNKDPGPAATSEDHLGVRLLLSSSTTAANLRQLWRSPVEGRVLVRNIDNWPMHFVFDSVNLRG
ncbi:hypothetical protein PG985_007814 [Apiospora marii]|uniref:uncharacterized protein n=1 Tax=Apiospora marii TaxID=335849 RepID=UPI00312F685C